LEDIAQGAIDAFMSAIGANSPATKFMPAGQYALQGVMEGMEGMMPALIDLVNTTGTNMINALKKNISKGGDVIRDMMDDLKSDIQKIAEQINDAIADGFGATASIDRQIAKNLDKFKDIPEGYRQYTEGALKQVQAEAQAFADPAEGAKYFKMRSDQILEFAQLQQDLAEATSQDDRDRITQQMNLINKAQTAEIAAFNAQRAGQVAPQEDIAAQIAALFSGDDLRSKLPAITENAIVAELYSLLGQLQQATSAPGPIYSSPAMTPAQQSWQASTTNNYGPQNTMAVYTNNSPAAIQQSWAVMQASMP
ncbi:MAG: hypothetical protein H7Z42_04525, partial [Roseiflexaceae bacterium]|nr:hypothetical protein [Roseiflexaceae bacterium]